MGSKNRFYADIMSMHQEVTGSCNLIIVKFPDGEATRFVVDCGLFQERKYDSFNETLQFNPENIDFCLVTHNHVDHTGRLPLMVKNGYRKDIYATETTCKLLPYALKDSFKVLNDVSKRKHEKCLYDETNVDDTLKLLKSCKYDETIQIDKHIKVTFLMNGHLIGSAVILVQISYPEYEDINLLFTGDYNNKNLFFDVTPIPEWIRKLPLTVIQESTYGAIDSSEIIPCFKDNIKKSMFEGETALTLVFSLGRAQEILYELKTMQNSGELDYKIPIYFDGKLAIKYTEMYIQDGLDVKEEMRDFLPENLTFVTCDNRQVVLEDTNAKIIVTTSGMGSYGPAQTYIPEYIKRKNTLIHFTGYTAEGTLGNRLQDTKHGDLVPVGGLIARKLARVEYTREYSAHAKADEMLEFLKQFENIRLILLNHGETKTKEIFAEKIINELDPKNIGLLDREYFFRVNPYGLVKTLSTKFN